MIVWGALLLPVITAWVLYRFYAHRCVWWEYVLPLAISLTTIIAGKAIVEHVMVSCDEYFGSFVETAEYYEDWNEYHHRTCTTSCGKNCIRTYDCSYVEYHPPYWQINTTTGESVRVNQIQYLRLKLRYGNSRFVDLHRHYHTDDGDKYVSTWPQDSARAEPVTTLHSYENRVKAADHSIFHFRDVPEEVADSVGLFGYPDIVENYYQLLVLGDTTLDAKWANRKLQWWNGKLGPEKEVRLFVLVFHDQPRTTGILQEWHWCGANMNEFVVCIGVDKERRVQWCHPFSWTHAEILKPKVKQFVEAQDKLSLAKLTDFLGPQVQEHFVRRDFAEFNYLTVEPSGWALFTIYLVTALACAGMGYAAVNNQHDPQ